MTSLTSHPHRTGSSSTRGEGDLHPLRIRRTNRRSPVSTRIRGLRPTCTSRTCCDLRSNRQQPGGENEPFDYSWAPRDRSRHARRWGGGHSVRRRRREAPLWQCALLSPQRQGSEREACLSAVVLGTSGPGTRCSMTTSDLCSPSRGATACRRTRQPTSLRSSSRRCCGASTPSMTRSAWAPGSPPSRAGTPGGRSRRGGVRWLPPASLSRPSPTRWTTGLGRSGSTPAPHARCPLPRAAGRPLSQHAAGLLRRRRCHAPPPDRQYRPDPRPLPGQVRQVLTE